MSAGLWAVGNFALCMVSLLLAVHFRHCARRWVPMALESLAVMGFFGVVASAAAMVAAHA